MFYGYFKCLFAVRPASLAKLYYSELISQLFIHWFETVGQQLQLCNIPKHVIINLHIKSHNSLIDSQQRASGSFINSDRKKLQKCSVTSTSWMQKRHQSWLINFSHKTYDLDYQRWCRSCVFCDLSKWKSVVWTEGGCVDVKCWIQYVEPEDNQWGEGLQFCCARVFVCVWRL